MRRIVIAIMSTISTLVMLFALDASHRSSVTTTLAAGGGSGRGSGTATGATGNTDTLGTGTTSSSSGAGANGNSTSSSAAGTTKTTTASKNYLGQSVMTRWGPVQVRITVKSGKIVASSAVVYPNSNGNDMEINGYALPVLDADAVTKQSADLDAISGATVTTEGYKQSLQSAIDRAHI